MPTLSLHSPLGPLTLSEDEGRITRLDWGWSAASEETGLLSLARDQLADYFDGRRQDFALPLAPAGTDFQRRVWKALYGIPYGEIRSYGDIAGTLSSSPRAVGTACGRNPIPVIIPCHRVVGADGRLTGYSGGDGLATKEFLIELEDGRAFANAAL